MLDSLRRVLEEKQAIPFVEYMQHVLYAPVDGYYSSLRPKFGAGGDFITAPELTPLFGRTLARQCRAILADMETADILEFGAGSGRLCIDVLRELEQLGQLPRQYYILEVSAALRVLQQENIGRDIPHLAERVRWLDALPASFHGVVLANEVLDAMPVHRFLLTEEALLESWISLDGEGGLQEAYRPQVDAALRAHVQNRLPPLPTPYQSEVNLWAGAWIQSVAAMLEQGVILLLDYGFPRHEYYHPDRRLGTLMCHQGHRSHPDPLQGPGTQDITAHVDFTYVAEEADAAGLQVLGFSNQAAFLLANDLLGLLSTDLGPADALAQTQAVKTLTQPQEMGELFKVMALGKAFDADLQGFLLLDKRATL
ncbi:MAG: SAM-dependent methyltransferase [Legionellaceae bacterium]|nr:SAM-dependent methyltransferase [Legionellaceae bacterium]